MEPFSSKFTPMSTAPVFFPLQYYQMPLGMNPAMMQNQMMGPVVPASYQAFYPATINNMQHNMQNTTQSSYIQGGMQNSQSYSSNNNQNVKSWPKKNDSKKGKVGLPVPEKLQEELYATLPPKILEELSQPVETPDEIAAYIAKRKRAFPTVQNVAEKIEKSAEQKRLGMVEAKKRKGNAPMELKNPLSDPFAIELPVPTKPCKYFLKGKCRNGTKCKNVHEESANVKQKGLHLPKPVPSLLKKLLETERSRDFNAVLQCFRHLKNKNLLNLT